jgi:murein DD-endopeptidase MepM/ murein hydrolase activator NlpD
LYKIIFEDRELELKNKVYMKQALEVISLKPPYILITLIIFLVPLWILEWGPLTIEPPGITNIIPDDRSIQQVNEAKKSVVIPNIPAFPITKKVIISTGDTLMKISTRVGLPQSLAYRAIRSLSKIYDSKNILPGQEIEYTFKSTSTLESGNQPRLGGNLTTIIFRPDSHREYIITLNAENRFNAKLFERPTETKLFYVKGRIISSLYLAAIESGMPITILMDMIRVYSWDIDFQRSIRSGDRFELLYEAKVTNTGIMTRSGNILYANLNLGSLAYPLFRFKLKNGSTDFFDSKGHSAQKALMRTPINGARLSSRYGTRRHPILGFNKMHRGVDFAAPRGTPIFAAGSGTIVYRSRNGAYGNYIRIRHNSQYSTAYAHLSKFNRNVTKGSRVRQGQIIGYVGTTGRSTGPHLHYEILRRGRQINPMRVKMPSGTRLKGPDQITFKISKAKILQKLQTLSTK